MTKRRKKNSIAKTIVLGLGRFVLAMIGATLIIAMFALAYLQESYRLNPPSKAERAEHPVLIDFLIGSDSETETRTIPLYPSLSQSPLFGISEWRKPNELCRVATLVHIRRSPR